MLQTQLDALEDCGIVPQPGVGFAELLAHFREREYETDPFRKLLIALGSDTRGKHPSPLSDAVWHVRAGCIAGPGDYVKLASRMSALTRGALRVSDLCDEFDLRRGVAWLRFRTGDRLLEWPAKLQEWWIDPLVLSRFVRLLEEQNTEKRYTVLDLGGQDYLLGCSTPEEFAALRKRTGLNFEWLD